MPLLNQLLNPNLQVLRSWLVHHDMVETPGWWGCVVGWLVGWLVDGWMGWLCESARCKVDYSSTVILEMSLSRLRFRIKQE